MKVLRLPAVIQLSEAKRKLLQNYLEGKPAQPGVASSPIIPSASKEATPLAICQEQLFLRETSRPVIPPLYNECIQLRMAGTLNVLALEQSLAEIIRRHEIWRTSYVVKNGQPLQVIHPATDPVRLPMIDLQGLSPTKQEEEVLNIIKDLLERPFNLSDGPLWKARLIKLGHLEHRLYLIAHLSIVDGVSVYQVFPTELAALYRAHASGWPSALPAASVQFRDYASWQRLRWRGSEVGKQFDYWRMQLGGEIPPLNWPSDRPRPAKETFRGAIQPFVLATPEAAKGLSRQAGSTLFVTLLALFASLLHIYTGQDDFLIGTPSPAGRKRSEVQKLLGYFLNPVALRFRLTRKTTFRDLLRQAHRLTLEALSNDDVPLEILARELNMKADPSRNPFFTVAISLQPRMPKLNLNWSVTSMDISSGGAPWDLYLAFIDAPEGMMGRAQYNPDLFETESIVRMLGHYQQLLEIASTNPDRRLSEIQLPSD